MKSAFRSTLALVFLISAYLPNWAIAASPIQTTCQSFTAPAKWSYCVTRTEGSTNPDLLYYFHGAGGDEKGWSEKSHEPLRQTWEKIGHAAPTVVSISFGEVWLLAEKNASPASGLFELFVGFVIPKVEAELGGLKGKRLLFGLSMGGYNVSQLVLKAPDLFARAVLACPGFAGISVYSSQDDVMKYVERTGANPEKVQMAIEIARAFYPDEASWNRGSPLVLAEMLLSEKTPPLHISCGRQDDYGFFEGARIFADKASLRSRKEVLWQSIQGKHCTLDQKSIAEFLAQAN
jgi:pimeloyl-ACP methyl ester carboxylesterase